MRKKRQVMWRMLGGAAAATAGVWAACMKVGPNYVRPELPASMPASFRGASTTQAAADRAHLATNWWVLFKDPLLTRLEEDAVKANPDLRAAMERVAEARAAAKIVQSQFYPQITLDPTVAMGLGPRTNSQNKNQVQWNTGVAIPFDLGYEIDIWGVNARSLESANANIQNSADQFAVVMQTLEADVAQDYMNLRSLEKQDQILTETVQLYQKQLGLTQQLQQAGLAGNLDVAQVRAQLDQITAQQLDLRRQRTDAQHALAILTGVPPENFEIGPPTLEMEAPEIPVGLPADLLRNRPDVVAAEQNVVAANAQVGVAIASFYPTVRLTGTAGFENTTIQKVMDWQSVLLSFGPSVSVPIFEGGLLEATLEQAKGHYRELVATYDSTLLAALQDVEVSLTDVHSYASQLTAQQHSVASSAEYRRLADLEYSQGLLSLLNLIDADKTELAAEQTEEQIRNNRLVSTVLLIKAVGGGWSPDNPLARPPTTTQAAGTTTRAAATTRE